MHIRNVLASPTEACAQRRAGSCRPCTLPKSWAGAGAGAGGNTIADNFSTIEEVQKGLRHAGLESSNLVIGVDFTKSNTWTGEMSFGGKCLHDVSDENEPNPYERVIELVGRTLQPFDDDDAIRATRAQPSSDLVS